MRESADLSRLPKNLKPEIAERVTEHFRDGAFEFDFSTEEMIAVEGNTVYHVIPHYAEGEAESVLDKLPDILKEDGYPDVQAFMRTFREMESVVEQYNRDLAEWERQTSRKSQNADKQQRRPPERESVLKRLHQIQSESKRINQPRQQKKSIDRER